MTKGTNGSSPVFHASQSGAPPDDIVPRRDTTFVAPQRDVIHLHSGLTARTRDDV
jgi:hypothetical protein